MGVVIRQGFKATIVGYIGALIGAVIVIFVYPYCLKPEEIGLIRVLIEAGTFLSFFCQMGMSNVAIKFFPYFKNKSQQHNGFFFLITFFPLIGFFLFLLVFAFFQDSISGLFVQKSKLVSDYIIYIVPITFFMVYIVVYEAYSSLLQRIVVPKIIKEVIIRILTALIIILLYFKVISLNTFVFCFVGIYGIALILNIFYINIIQPITLKPNLKFLTKPLVKEIGLFMLFMIVAGAGSNISSKIDVYMISTKLSLSDTGIFTIAFFIAAFIEMPARSIYQISTPIASDMIMRNDITSLESLYKKVAINQLLIGGILLILIWVNVDNIFSIMPNGHLYEKGKYVIFFIGISKVFDAATGINASILNNSKYYYYLLFFIFFLAFLAIVNNMIFIPLYGITGAAIATAISIFLYNSILVGFVWIKMKIQPFSINTLKALVILCALCLINFAIWKLKNPYLDAIIRSSVLLLVFVFVVLKFKISEDINTFYSSILNKVKTIVLKNNK